MFKSLKNKFQDVKDNIEQMFSGEVQPLDNVRDEIVSFINEINEKMAAINYNVHVFESESKPKAQVDLMRKQV